MILVWLIIFALIIGGFIYPLWWFIGIGLAGLVSVAWVICGIDHYNNLTRRKHRG